MLLILKVPIQERNKRGSELELRSIKSLVKGDCMGPDEILQIEVIKILH